MRFNKAQESEEALIRVTRRIVNESPDALRNAGLQPFCAANPLKPVISFSSVFSLFFLKASSGSYP